jgi:hypothetical protein
VAFEAGEFAGDRQLPAPKSEGTDADPCQIGFVQPCKNVLIDILTAEGRLLLTEPDQRRVHKG